MGVADADDDQRVAAFDLLGNRSGAVGLVVGFSYVFGGILLHLTNARGSRCPAAWHRRGHDRSDRDPRRPPLPATRLERSSCTPSTWANGSGCTGRSHEGGPATSGELAMRTGTNERYLREWLEHHAASGLLDVDDVAADPLARRFSLPAAHAPGAARPRRRTLRPPTGRSTSCAPPARCPDLVDAFRNGTAPPTAALGTGGPGRRQPRGCIWLTWATEWLPAIPDIDRRLRARAHPRGWPTWPVGLGSSSIAIARAYPLVKIEGFDLDRGGDRVRPSTPPRRRGWRTGCRSPSPTPRIQGCPAGSTW